MADWNALLDHLASGPRENGTPELAATASWLADELRMRGATVDRWRFLADTWRLRIVGVVALAGAAAYVAAMLRKRYVLAALVTLAVPSLLIAELDFGGAVLGGVHQAWQENLIATLPLAAQPKQLLIFSAHYDTKTDLLDHVQRAPINFLGLPVTVLMLVAAVVRFRQQRAAKPQRWRHLSTVSIAAAALNGVGLFLSLTGGAFVPTRSPGAIDDGASCAVLLELASTLRLQNTQVQLVFFSGEEIGLQGSWLLAKNINRSLPMQVINLDGMGLAKELALFKAESGVLRSWPPDPKLVAAVEGVTPLYRTFYPATTDARSFLEAGIPAINLASDLPGHALPRHMHSSADARSLVSLEALDDHVRVLTEVAKRLDLGGP